MNEETQVVPPTSWIDWLLFLSAIVGLLFVVAVWTSRIPFEIVR